MNKILLLIGSIFSIVASADNNFNHVENNLGFRYSDFGMDLRIDAGAPDKNFVQLSYFSPWRLQFDYRYIYHKEDIENRFRLTYSGWSWGDRISFGIKPRVEYRHLDPQNYGNAKILTALKYKPDDKWVCRAEFIPAWNFGGTGDKAANFAVDSAEFVVGVMYNLTDKTDIGTFVQLNTNNNWNKTEVFLGTNFVVSF